MKGTQGIGTKQSCSHKKATYQWGNLGGKRLQFAREHKDWSLEQRTKVIWSDQSRFTQFKSDGSIRVRREVGEVMRPSCLVSSTQAWGGSAVILGCCSWTGVGWATLCTKLIRSPDYLDTLNDQVVPNDKDLADIFQDGNARIRKAWIMKSASGNTRHHFHTWIFHHSADLSPTESLWDVLG